MRATRACCCRRARARLWWSEWAEDLRPRYGRGFRGVSRACGDGCCGNQSQVRAGISIRGLDICEGTLVAWSGKKVCTCVQLVCCAAGSSVVNARRKCTPLVTLAYPWSLHLRPRRYPCLLGRAPCTWSCSCTRCGRWCAVGVGGLARSRMCTYRRVLIRIPWQLHGAGWRYCRLQHGEGAATGARAFPSKYSV